MKLQILFFAAGLLLSLAFGEFVLRFLPSFTPQPLAYVGEYRDEPHYVRLYINYLRQKLEKDPANPKYILTERGVGYRFVDYKRQKA